MKDRVNELVAQIPKGRVMTYGQIAALSGHPRAARQVGQIAHWGDPSLAWHRVVNKTGGLARAFTSGGIEAQRRLLEAEGIDVDENYQVDIDVLLWDPHE